MDAILRIFITKLLYASKGLVHPTFEVIGMPLYRRGFNFKGVQVSNIARISTNQHGL